MVLQSTDKCNFKVLKFISDHRESLNPFELLGKEHDGPTQHAALQVLFRLFEAQPFLRKFWDPLPLFSVDASRLRLRQPADKSRGIPVDLVLDYSRRMLHDSGVDHSTTRSRK